MVFTMELTYSEIEKILDMRYFPTSSTGYTLPLEFMKLVTLI